jgi:hypothetical protein
MMIEIHKPELEALIQQRIENGTLPSVEDVLLQALKALPVAKPNLAAFLINSPLAGSGLSTDRNQEATGAQLVAAMQASPAKEISLEPGRTAMPVRDVTF